MISCFLEVNDNAEELYEIFKPEHLDSERARCKIKKGRSLIFEIEAKDPVSMKAFTNSILNIIITYQKTAAAIR